jgi:hypothetical protein
VTHLGVADLAGRVGQDRALALEQLREVRFFHGGQGADSDVVAAVADVVQVADAADVDQHRRGGQPQPHQRQQRVPAGQQLGFLAVLAEEADGVVG